MTLVMFFFCFWKEKRFYYDNFVKLFFCYVLFFCIGVLTSTLDFSYFLKRLFGDYFVAYIALWTIKIMVKTNKISVFFNTIIVLSLFDGFVTFCQFLGLPYMDSIINRFGLVTSELYQDLQGSEVQYLTGCAPGIMPNAVVNAQLLLAGLVLTLNYWENRKLIILPIAFCLFVFLFATQQRTALGAAVIAYFLFFYKSISYSKYKIIWFFLVGIVLSGFSYYLYSMLSNSEFRIVELGFDLTGRELIYQKAYDFILNNPLGGINDFLDRNEVYPHNIFLNALIYGGWIGGIILIGLYIQQIRESLLVITNKRLDPIYMTLCCTLLALSINGLTHNQSIVNGEVIVLMTWACLMNYKAVINY